MKKQKIIRIAVAIWVISVPPIVVNAQTAGEKAAAKTVVTKRLYFDHRGRVSTIGGDTLVINDRAYQVLSNVTLLSVDQTPIAGLNRLKPGDYIGFTVDDEHLIDAIYLLNPFPKTGKNKK